MPLEDKDYQLFQDLIKKIDKDILLEMMIGLQSSSRMHLNLMRDKDINQKLQDLITTEIHRRIK